MLNQVQIIVKRKLVSLLYLMYIMIRNPTIATLKFLCEFNPLKGKIFILQFWHWCNLPWLVFPWQHCNCVNYVFVCHFCIRVFDKHMLSTRESIWSIRFPSNDSWYSSLCQIIFTNSSLAWQPGSKRFKFSKQTLIKMW